MHNTRGSVLVICYLLVTVMVAFGGVLMVRSANEQGVARRHGDLAHAFQLAESALDLALIQLRARDMTLIGPTSFAQGTYQATISQPNLSQPDQYLIQASGQVTDPRRIEVVAQVMPRSVFQFAMFGSTWIDMGGNAVTDNFDSCTGSYDPQTAGTEGDIGTNGTTVGSVDFDGSSLRVKGTVAVGPNVSNPESLVTNYDPSLVMGNPKVASQAIALLNPVIVIPPCQTTLPPLVNNTRTFATGTDYCPSNTQPVTINGNEAWTATGPVAIYFSGELTINGNAVVGVVDQPTMMKLYLTTSTKVPVINGDAKFYGSLYAPNVQAKINGNAEIFGSIVADKADLSGNAKIHYDQCLSKGTGPTGGYNVQVLSWREP